jgi:NAD(P)-dependent dehydrogenase (short-subunit alcohol dehydrogenase family)
MVLGFARAGADVVIASRKLDACERLAEEVRQETGREALAYACHVGRWDDLPGLVEAAYERFGRIDVLVNNAGMSPLYDSVEAVTEDLYDKVQAVNLKGPFRLSALVGSRMVAAGSGVIINVSSAGSIRPGPESIPYAAAKAGINTMTEAFAKVFGPHVRVNCLMPGPFRTDAHPEAVDYDDLNALHRWGNPDEIVGAALFLASDASSFTTGAIVRVDGGIA